MISYNIICRKNNDSIDLESLAGKEIIVQMNDSAHGYLKETGLTDKIIVVETIEDTIKLLSSGEHDAVISFDVSSFYFVRKGNYKNLRVHFRYPGGKILDCRQYRQRRVIVFAELCHLPDEN